MPIYKDTITSNNDDNLYEKVAEDRGIKRLIQHRTKIFDEIDLSTLVYNKYIWKKDDNLFKVANRFFPNRNYWWIIAYVNNKPTDAHFEIGDEVLIPSSELFGRL